MGCHFHVNGLVLFSPCTKTLFDVFSSDQAKSVTTSPKVISAMDNTQKKGVSHGKAEGSSAQHRSHSPNNDSYEDGYSGDRVS